MALFLGRWEGWSNGVDARGGSRASRDGDGPKTSDLPFVAGNGEAATCADTTRRTHHICTYFYYTMRILKGTLINLIILLYVL